MQAALAIETDAHGDFDAVLAELMEAYPGIALSDVQETRRHAAEIAAGMPCAEIIAAIYGVAHNVKGQGASFGYHLMTIFGEAICTMLRGQTTLTAEDLRQLRDQVDACEEILAQRLTGTGGERGEALLSRIANLQLA